MGLCSSYSSLAGSGNTRDYDPDRPAEERISEDETSHQDEVQPEDEEEGDEEDPDWFPDSDDEQETGSNGEGVTEEPSAQIPEDHTTPASPGDEHQASSQQSGEGGCDRVAIELAEAKLSQAPGSGALHLLYRGAGLLRRISEACRLTTRTVAHASLCGHVYDNINMMFRIAEQILGRKDSQENGTCATIFPLFDARAEDMQTADVLESFNNAPQLAARDIRHSKEEATLFQHSLEHAALRDIVFRTDLFGRFRNEVMDILPGTDSEIPIHRTEVYPLPAMNIDESSVTGNADVVDTIFAELGFDMGTTKFSGIVRPIFGDQLSIARLRALMVHRAGNDSLPYSYAYLVFGPGFFHHQMALTHGIIETHWGDPHAGTRNPGCLSFLNTVLDRKPIVLSSLPPYRTCRDLILTSLSACLLHCLERVSGCTSLEAYAADVTFEQLREHVGDIMATYVNPNTVASMRRARQEATESVIPAPLTPATHLPTTSAPSATGTAPGIPTPLTTSAPTRPASTPSAPTPGPRMTRLSPAVDNPCPPDPPPTSRPAHNASNSDVPDTCAVPTSSTSTATTFVPAFSGGGPTPAFTAHISPKPRAPTASSNQTDATPSGSSNTSRGHNTRPGDVVYENMCLFLRDALVLREFTDAIKGGYSGRIIRALKLLALMYRGSGRTKYAHELLHLVHNLTHVWPNPLRDIMIKNWLVNPTGKPNSWVPVDLLQEHMNFWIKVIYKAQGSNASWDWLKMISPCIALLRQLALEVNGTLGAKLGTKHHSPDITPDLVTLCNSLREHNVFEVEQGRVIDMDDIHAGVVPNIVAAGLKQLQGPLEEYNLAFLKLQTRRRMSPLGETTPPVDDSSTSVEHSGAITLLQSDVENQSHGIPVMEGEGSEEVAGEDEDLWRFFDDDPYEPRDFFEAEENPSLDLDDY